MKKILVICLCLMMSLTVCAPAFASGSEVVSFAVNPYGGGADAIDTFSWFAKDDAYYLFLPADTDLNTAKVWFDASGAVTLDGAVIENGDPAAALTPAALFDAMEKGDFYASCGVELEDVQFDGKTLHVSVPAKKDVAYTIRFITTKRGADTGIVQTVSIPQAGKGRSARPARTVPVYSSAVGATAKSVSGKKGDRVAAEYGLADDDLYVRARVESDERAPYYVLGGKGAMHPKVAMAWTQPCQRS